ncbi:MAG: ABC-three component system protein [Pseudomonadota bacterium]
MGDEGDKYGASAAALGYAFQPRLALQRLLEAPEDASLFLERGDDIEMVRGGRTELASLKHKAAGGTLTNLSTDFWKSVRIWLARYRDAAAYGNCCFVLLTTEEVREDSFLHTFVAGDEIDREVVEQFRATAASSRASPVGDVLTDFETLPASQQLDFLRRIEIQVTHRIHEIPDHVKDHSLRAVAPKYRGPVFERLEGWWTNRVIDQLDGTKPGPIRGIDLSDKLAEIAERFRTDDLPIDFARAVPSAAEDPSADGRMFVRQLQALGFGDKRLRHAIIDYYRAWEQRSAWARDDLLHADELEDYEDRLVEEWDRYRAVACEALKDTTSETDCVEMGRELQRWADRDTIGEEFRIRARVAERYVVRGGFHILANGAPTPRIYWHPRFLDRLAEVLEKAS